MNPFTTNPGSGQLTAGDIGIAKLRKGVEYCSASVSVFFSAVFRGNPDDVWGWMERNGWTGTQLKKHQFTAGEREALMQKRMAFCDMDITLQIRIIKVIWDMSDETADKLNEIKDIRNKISHEVKALEEEMKDAKKFEHTLNQLRDLAVVLLETLKPYPSLSLTHDDINLKKQEIKYLFTELQSHVVVVDVRMAKEILKDLMRNSDILKVLGHLQCFASTTGMGPVKLEDIYTAISLQREERGIHPQDKGVIPIKLEEILATTTPGGKTPHLICLEGPAGAGKSTLLARVASERQAGSKGIKGLDSFDLVLHFVFKNNTCINLTELVKLCLQPRNIADGLLLRATRELKVLVLADGFDEVVNNGRDLLKDILKESRHGHGSLQVLLTTRTGCLSQAVNLVQGVENLCITVSPIPEKDKEIMVKKYYNVLAAMMTSPPPEDEVVERVIFATTYIGETPFVIFQVTYLAMVKPDTVWAPMNLSQLYGLQDEINLDHLKRCLKSKGLPVEKILGQINCFNRLLNEDAFKAVLKGDAKIDPDRLQQLASICDHPKDMLDAHMLSKTERTFTGNKVVRDFPHVNYLEYRAALAVLDILMENSYTSLKDALELRGLRKKVLLNVLRRLENLLRILPGVLKNINMFSRYSFYADDLAKLLVMAFGNSGDVALKAIAEAKGDTTLTKEFVWLLPEPWRISKHFHLLRILKEYPTGVSIVLMRCCNEEPYLKEAIELVCRNCRRVSLHQAPCWECESGCCTWPIATLTKEAVLRCLKVKHLTGPWGLDAPIPPSFGCIEARFASIESLTNFLINYNNLKYLEFSTLEVHVSAPGVRDRVLLAPEPPLWLSHRGRRLCNVVLWHLGDGDVVWTKILLSSLGRTRWDRNGLKNSYETLFFRESSLTPTGLEILLETLETHRIRARYPVLLAPTLAAWEAHWSREEERERLASNVGVRLDFIQPYASCSAYVDTPRHIIAEAEGLPRLLKPGNTDTELVLAPPLRESALLTTELEFICFPRQGCVKVRYGTTTGRQLLKVNYNIDRYADAAMLHVETSDYVSKRSSYLRVFALETHRVSIVEQADHWEVRLDIAGEVTRWTGVFPPKTEVQPPWSVAGRTVRVSLRASSRLTTRLLSLRVWEEPRLEMVIHSPCPRCCIERGDREGERGRRRCALPDSPTTSHAPSSNFPPYGSCCLL